MLGLSGLNFNAYRSIRHTAFIRINGLVSLRRWATSTAFGLEPTFLQEFRSIKPPFGYNGLGEVVYRRTYSRPTANGMEDWCDTVARVVNGTFNLQKNWIEQHNLGWSEEKAQKSAQDMYRRMFEMKFLPPGRGLWAMGSPLTESKGMFAALNNCAFVSTMNLKDDPSKPFTFLMDASMLGVGVGFDTLGAGTLQVQSPWSPGEGEVPNVYVIPDSREGWVSSVQMLIDSYLADITTTSSRRIIDFDYSQIRAAGQPIQGFGGKSSGPAPLKELHDTLRMLLNRDVGKLVSSTLIVDMFNVIGRSVVAGNVRQTAEIAFGKFDDTEFLELKDYEKNPERISWGWTSNNSIFAELGMDYAQLCKSIQLNGEPGLAFLENMRQFSRMDNMPDGKDHRAMGGNPCLEQTLESMELCCLVETFPARASSLEDYLETLKCAFLYAKSVTLASTHWPESNRVMLRNRRVGTSMSGIAQFISEHGIHALRNWSRQGYETLKEVDASLSDWLAVPRSIKITSIKPSGTVSLLAGATPGMHYPESRYYIRRMRLSARSELLAPLQAAGYSVEPCANSPEETMVVSFPIDMGGSIRTASSVSMWEQLSLAAFLQEHWADNQVSCTVTFDPETEGPHLESALNYFQYSLKGVSFLPRLPSGAYPQMPYEAIDVDTFLRMQKDLKPLDFAAVKQVDTQIEKFCDSESCTVEFQSEAPSA